MTHPTRQFSKSKSISNEKVNSTNHRHYHFMFSNMHGGFMVQFLITQIKQHERAIEKSAQRSRIDTNRIGKDFRNQFGDNQQGRK